MNSNSVIGSVTFLGQRHGNAAKAKNDLARPLSEKGEKQREAAKSGIDTFGPFDLVLTSPAQRAQMTVERDGVTTVVLPALYFPADRSEDRVIADKVYDRIGNAPLAEHLASEAGPVLLRWAANAAQAVIEQVRIGEPMRVLVGGHGVYTQALMLQLALLMGVDVTIALTTPLAEGDALVLNGDGLAYLACPAVE